MCWGLLHITNSTLLISPVMFSVSRSFVLDGSIPLHTKTITNLYWAAPVGYPSTPNEPILCFHGTCVMRCSFDEAHVHTTFHRMLDSHTTTECVCSVGLLASTQKTTHVLGKQRNISDRSNCVMDPVFTPNISYGTGFWFSVHGGQSRAYINIKSSLCSNECDFVCECDPVWIMNNSLRVLAISYVRRWSNSHRMIWADHWTIVVDAWANVPRVTRNKWICFHIECGST